MHPTTSVRVGRSWLRDATLLPLELSPNDCSSECFQDTKNGGNVNPPDTGNPQKRQKLHLGRGKTVGQLPQSGYGKAGHRRIVRPLLPACKQPFGIVGSAQA